MFENRIAYFVTLFALIVSAAPLAVAQDPQKLEDFRTVLEKKLEKAPKLTIDRKGNTVAKTGIAIAEFCDLGDPVASRVFREYGAMFVGINDVFAGYTSFRRGKEMALAVNCVFPTPAAAAAYQEALRGSEGTRSETVGGVRIELQTAAMNALLLAVSQAAAVKLRITPRGGPIAAKRSFEETKRLWDSRFLPGLAYWTGKGRITREQADAARALDIPGQVRQVLEWESRGLWFSKDLSKSILYSVAAPGASQHIFMVALDVEQFANPEVRRILARNGWFQTVLSDLPHFTYLGAAEAELPLLGLEARTVGGQKFWIPRF